MTGRDPLDELRNLAEVGERAARPDSPEVVRARGDRRGRRRRIGTAVGALAVAVLVGVAGTSIATRSGLLPNVPDPAASPTITASPVQVITEANLPTDTDLEWHRPGDWKITNTYPGSGSDVASECFQAKPESLGSTGSFYRTYDFDGAFGSATALQFDTAAAAEEAYRTLIRWGDECEQTMTDRGHRRVKSVDWDAVTTEHGEARYRVMLSDLLDDPKAVEGNIEEYGLIVAGDRVEIVTMKLVGMDHIWTTEPNDGTGLALDPMIRSLPKAAARLVGAPVPQSPAPSGKPDSPSKDPGENPTGNGSPPATAGEQSEDPPASGDPGQEDPKPDPGESEEPPVEEPEAPKLTAANQVAAGDLPKREGLTAKEYDNDARPDQRPSVCFAEGLDALKATDSRQRNFRYVITDPDSSADPDDPLFDKPTLYTTALQFADEKAAAQAYETLSGWIEDCANALDDEGYRAPGGGPVRGFDRWYPVRGDLDSARFTEFMYQEQGVDDGFGYFEAVGLVRVGSRVAITVDLKYSQDSNWDSDPEAGVAGPHLLADLLPAAAKRLS